MLDNPETRDIGNEMVNYWVTSQVPILLKLAISVITSRELMLGDQLIDWLFDHDLVNNTDYDREVYGALMLAFQDASEENKTRIVNTIMESLEEKFDV